MALARLLPAAAAAVVAVVGLLVMIVRDDERPAAPKPPAAQSPQPEPDARLPRGPRTLAGELAGTRAALYEAIDLSLIHI